MTPSQRDPEGEETREALERALGPFWERDLDGCPVLNLDALAEQIIVPVEVEQISGGKKIDAPWDATVIHYTREDWEKKQALWISGTHGAPGPALAIIVYDPAQQGIVPLEEEDEAPASLPDMRDVDAESGGLHRDMSRGA